MDFAYLLKVLLKRKWIILGSAILAAGIAYYFTMNEPKQYLSTSRISTGFAVPDEIKLNENFTLLDAEVKFNNAITAWMSPSVISLLSYKLILHDLNEPSPFRKLTEEQKQSPFYKAINLQEAKKVYADKLADMSVLTSYKPEEKKLLEFLHLYKYDFQMIRQHINIYQVPRTDYIQIDCITENPELSAFIVNNVFEQFINYYRNIRSSKSQESVDTLQSIMDKKKQVLDEKNKLLRGEGLVDVTTESSSNLDQISELEKTLTYEKGKQTDNYYALRKINQRLSTDNAPTDYNNGASNNEELIIARRAVNDAYKKYLNSNSQEDLDRYNQLQAEYKKKYSSISTSVKPANDKEKEINTLTLQKNDLEIDIEAGDAKIKALESRISILKGNVASISTRGATVETMMEEVKLAEREYIEAKQKYNDALDMTSSAVNNFRQLQTAQPAIEPLPSKRKMIIGMAGTAALLTSILIITLLTYLDSSVKTPRVFARNVGLKLISMVNFVNLKKKNLKEVVATRSDDSDKIEKKRSNIFRESIRKLRYEVESSGKKIFLFTSTKKSQGKTTLIQALSYSLSLSKKKILIIDTNFSNNDLTRQLDADPVLETISMNTEFHRFKDKMKQIVGTGGEDEETGSIYVIGSEGGDYTPSEVLPRENVLKYLTNLTNDFDYIFLEGPPLNDFSDAKELTQYVEGVIAIFSAQDTIKQIDKESIRFYKDLNDKFIGSVLNMVDLENVNTI